MVGLYREPVSRRNERFSGPAVLAVLATAGVAAWVGYEYSQWPPPPPGAAAAAAQEQEPQPRTPRPQRVALLTDSPPADDSWFERSVGSSRLRDYAAGVVPDSPGPDTAALLPLVDELGKADWVIVQAGASDLLAGRTAEETTAGVTELLEVVREAGYQVAWATVPPLGAEGADVLSVNEQLTAWAEDNGVPVLGLFDAVGDVDGTHQDGMSDEGLEPTQAAVSAQARLARKQLPTLLERP